jgi:hypothetical protein
LQWSARNLRSQAACCPSTQSIPAITGQFSRRWAGFSSVSLESLRRGSQAFSNILSITYAMKRLEEIWHAKVADIKGFKHSRLSEHAISFCPSYHNKQLSI